MFPEPSADTAFHPNAFLAQAVDAVTGQLSVAVPIRIDDEVMHVRPDQVIAWLRDGHPPELLNVQRGRQGTTPAWHDDGSVIVWGVDWAPEPEA